MGFRLLRLAYRLMTSRGQRTPGTCPRFAAKALPQQGRMSMRRVMFMSLLFGVARAAPPVLAEMAAPQPAPAGPPAYGEQINLDQAKKAAAAAMDEAKKINTFMAIAVVSPSGDLVYFEKMDN